MADLSRHRESAPVPLYAAAAGKLKLTPERLEQIAGSTPLKRYGQAEDLAAPAVFLASEASAFITGHTLDVNGGLSMG